MWPNDLDMPNARLEESESDGGNPRAETGISEWSTGLFSCLLPASRVFKRY